MMRYYAQYNSNGKLVSVGTGPGGMEITKAEYDAILLEIREKATLAEQLYNGEITIEDVPEQWQEEIQRRVEERQQMEADMPHEPTVEELQEELEDAKNALRILGVTVNG